MVVRNVRGTQAYDRARSDLSHLPHVMVLKHMIELDKAIHMKNSAQTDDTIGKNTTI